MRAIEITTFGGPEVLQLAERPLPEPGPGEVRIDIVAAGVNRPDLMQRQGLYSPPKGATEIPGLEVAGRVAAIGPADQHGPPASATGRVWQVGDEVTALVVGGGYAAACVVPGLQCLPVPAGLDLIEAAALPECGFTVWTNVFDRGRLAGGEWLLVHGGTGGIGTTAVQLATARGARVIATCGSADKCRTAERLGAVKAVNYRVTDFVGAVKDVTHGRGVDVILDVVGAPYTPRNLQCLAREGRLVQIGMMGGSRAEISLRTLLLRRLTITGSTLRVRTPEEKGAIAAALEREVWPLLAAGTIRPVIDSVLPLGEAAEAHRRLESGQVIGKLVLVTK